MPKNNTMSHYSFPILSLAFCLLVLPTFAQPELASASSPQSKQDNVFYKLAQENIFLTDVFDSPWYGHPDEKPGASWTESQKAIWLDSMLADVKFVAAAMREQMDDQDQVISGGRFDGQNLFDAMEASTEQDLLDFFAYVNYKPEKYRDHSWKLSEVYATWMVSETPMPAELSIDWIWNEEGTPAQADCDGESLFLNLKKGHLNKIKPTASFAAVKEALPCFTGETEEGVDYNCGGGVFYLNHDMFFYTGRDYIEVRAGFGGKISEDLLAKTEEEILALKGQPDLIPVYEDKKGWGFEVDKVYLYKTRYGALQINFDPESGKSVKLSVHSNAPEEVIICW
jgi:hypothetical protein